MASLCPIPKCGRLNCIKHNTAESRGQTEEHFQDDLDRDLTYGELSAIKAFDGKWQCEEAGKIRKLRLSGKFKPTFKKGGSQCQMYQ